MAHRFRQHYTPDDARHLLPDIRRWLADLRAAREAALEADETLAPLLKTGADIGGPTVTRLWRAMAALRTAADHFARREILIKDVGRGLIDFPAFIDGREVFLCWEENEDDVGYWHELDTGYAGRCPLAGQE